jgi:hypothetical protein
MHKVYLSRRNIQSLINKLDRVKTGDFSNCTIIKCDNLHAKYPQTMETCRVTAIEDGPKPPQGEQQIFLARKELNTLLGGLDAMAKTQVKGVLMELAPYDTDGIKRLVSPIGIEDKEYYESRAPGEVYHADDPGMGR